MIVKLSIRVTTTTASVAIAAGPHGSDPIATVEREDGVMVEVTVTAGR